MHIGVLGSVQHVCGWEGTVDSKRDDVQLMGGKKA